MDTQNIKPEENKCTQFHFQLDHGVTEAAATNFPYLYKWNPTLNLTTVSSWQKLSSLKFTKSNKLCYTEWHHHSHHQLRIFIWPAFSLPREFTHAHPNLLLSLQSKPQTTAEHQPGFKWAWKLYFLHYLILPLYLMHILCMCGNHFWLQTGIFARKMPPPQKKKKKKKKRHTIK